MTLLTGVSCLSAAPTQSSNNELIRRQLQIFFFSEKTKSTKTSSPYGARSDRTLTFQRVVTQNSILQSQICFKATVNIIYHFTVLAFVAFSIQSKDTC